MGEVKRTTYFDILNIVACIMVVALHCHGSFFEFSHTLGWTETLIVQVVAHAAVPVFYMLSGATLMEYRSRYGTKVYFKSRLTRVVVPFYIWSIIYLFIYNAQGIYVIEGARKVISDVLGNQVVGIFWFFTPLFGIYLCIPVLSLLAKFEYLEIFKYISIASFIVISVVPCIEMIASIKLLPVSFPIGSSYLMYPVLGYYLSKKKLKKHTRLCIYILGIIAALFMGIYTYYMSVAAGDANTTLQSYEMAPTYLMAMALFVFIKNLAFPERLSDKLKEIIKTIAGASFGIYLIHILLVDKFFTTFGGSVAAMILGTVFIYMACLMITLVIKKIPVLNKIMP
ncbi:MAG: acyltransferase [Suipraeoptans sp.]